MLFAYFGPETTLPIASGAAAVAGFVLMGGKLAMMKIRGLFGIKPASDPQEKSPEAENRQEEEQTSEQPQAV